MNVRTWLLVTTAVICSISGSHAARSILGTWCIDDEGLVIDFRTKDSLSVKSTTDETVSGAGAYTLSDSVFSTKVINGDLTLQLGYKYGWKSDSMITAKPLYFIVNGDTADEVTKWMTMRRCGTPAMPKGRARRTKSQ